MPHLIIQTSAAAATHTRDSDGVHVRITDLAGKSVAGTSPNIFPTTDGYTLILPAEPPVPAVVVPQEIKNWQAVAVLESAGALAAVNAALAAMPGPEGIVIRAAWAGGEPLRRDGQTVGTIAGILNFSPAQIDAWFIQAAPLTVP